MNKKSKGKARRCFTDEEISELSSYFDKKIAGDDKGLEIRNYTIIFTALNTGMRIGEILSWDVEDVWDGKRALQTSICDETKTNKVRVIELQEGLRNILQEYIKTKGYENDVDKPLFRNINNGRLKYRQTLNIFKKACADCGIRTTLIGCHSARKTYAKEALDAGNNNYSNVQKALGHTSIKTTYAYVTFNPKDVSTMIGKINFA
jgi:integrase